jgi:hypothetical protein
LPTAILGSAKSDGCGGGSDDDGDDDDDDDDEDSLCCVHSLFVFAASAGRQHKSMEGLANTILRMWGV